MKARRVVTFSEFERRRARRDYMRRYRARKGKGDSIRPYVMATVVPCAVEAEREAVLAAPRTPDQLLLGDPLPGRSALDRKIARASKRGIWG
jgi:alkanesulfonate monooxygenase SsuD/methylene tetrahydromethanopterin reductase-like flavin-dependent oxidoreductase (luciferase family)